MLHYSIFYQNKSILKYYVTIRKLERPPNKIDNFDIAIKKIIYIKLYLYIIARYACCMPKVHTNLFGPMVASRLSIPYHTGQYGRNILYRPAIRYAWPPYFIPGKISAVPALYQPYRSISGNTGRYRKKFFFFFLKFCNFWIFVRT